MTNLRLFFSEHISSGDRLRHAFSLVELLAAIAIIAITMSLAVPALSSLNASSQLTRASYDVADTIALARQAALSRNRCVTMRFFRTAASSSFTTFQAYVVQDDGTEEPLTRLYRMPESIVLSGNPKLSNLLQNSTNSTSLPNGEAVNFSEFRFHRDGATDLDPFGFWYFTLTPSLEAEKAVPANYVTFLVDPKNGFTRACRP